MKTLFVVGLVIIFCLPSLNYGQAPSIYSSDGEYLGNLNANPFDPNSINNPAGIYGSKYRAKSIKNPYGKYGSPYSSYSATNPYGSTHSPRVYSGKQYLGRLNANKSDPESISNKYGIYGSASSAKSINNPTGVYGSEFSPKSARNQFAVGERQYLDTSKEQIISIQKMLKSSGLYKGKIDGIAGSKTLDAVKELLENKKKK